MQPFDITEKVSMDDFMCDYFKESDTIEVPSIWLQQQLRELNSAKLELTKVRNQQQDDSRYLKLLKQKVDSLVLASEITKASRQVTRKYLDIKI